MAGMKSVCLLWFVQESKEDADTELLIGVYRTIDNAQLAIDRLKDQPGFRDFPEGFTIREYELDKESWTEGFVRV